MGLAQSTVHDLQKDWDMWYGNGGDCQTDAASSTDGLTKSLPADAVLPHEIPDAPPRKAFSKAKRAKGAGTRREKLNDKRVDVRDLHYSQPDRSYKKRFECGRKVAWLVQDLLERKVSVSAPFLTLTVFETPDRRNRPILKCMENRRLFALKEFAKKSGRRVMVNVDLFSYSTIMEVHRFWSNSDATDGHEVKLRRRKPKPPQLFLDTKSR